MASPGSRVVKVTSPRVIEGLQVRTPRLEQVIDSCICRLAGCGEAADGWATFVRPGKRILLKFMRLPGEGLQTNGAMLIALVESLRRAGHDPAAITVADCSGGMVDGLRPTPVGWSHRSVRVGRESEQVRRYLDDVDVVINVPSITDHNLTGTACALMNVSLPYIRHPARYFGNQLHESIASICADSQTLIRPSLTLVNALRCVYHAGPVVDSANVDYERGVWASTDPVAIDRLATDWIERRRKVNHLNSLAADGRPPTYIDLAAARGLGNNDIRHIRVETHQM